MTFDKCQVLHCFLSLTPSLGRFKKQLNEFNTMKNTNDLVCFCEIGDNVFVSETLFFQKDEVQIISPILLGDDSGFGGRSLILYGIEQKVSEFKLNIDEHKAICSIKCSVFKQPIVINKKPDSFCSGLNGACYAKFFDFRVFGYKSHFITSLDMTGKIVNENLIEINGFAESILIANESESLELSQIEKLNGDLHLEIWNNNKKTWEPFFTAFRFVNCKWENSVVKVMSGVTQCKTSFNMTLERIF